MLNNKTWACLAALVLTLGVARGSARAQMTFVRDIASPEDLLQLPASPWIVVSAMRTDHARGRLVLVDARDPAQSATLDLGAQPWAASFSPHGIDARALGKGKVELLVVDHGGGEFIDRLELALAGEAPPTLVRASRIALPRGVSANGVAALGDGFVLTSMFDPQDLGFVDKFARQEPTGTVWRWSKAHGFTEVARLPLSAANGIAVSRDQRTLIVSEWAANKLWRIPLDGKKPSSVPTPFHPDNLRWTDRGDLLLTGQLGDARTLFTCKPGSDCRPGYSVARVDPTSLRMQNILSKDDKAAAADDFGGGTGAIEVAGTLWIGQYIGDVIARVPLPRVY